MLLAALFFLAVHGLANAVAVLKFGLPLRKLCKPVPVLGTLLCCPPCLAFWIGVGMSWTVVSPAAQMTDALWKALLLDGLAASAFSWMAHATTERLICGVEGI